jgi:hypothetical protein
VIAGGVVWAADTSGRLTALELLTGGVIWQTELGTPVLAGLAIAGNHLVVASFDGSVRLLGPAISPPPVAQLACEPAPEGGGCCNAGEGAAALAPGCAVLAVYLRRRRRSTSPNSASPTGAAPAAPPALQL